MHVCCGGPHEVSVLLKVPAEDVNMMSRDPYSHHASQRLEIGQREGIEA
jgi:hypothetical protein